MPTIWSRDGSSSSSPCTRGGFVAISIYLPTYLVQAYGLDLTDAAARAAGFVVLATLARPIGGFIADRLGGAPTLNGAFCLAPWPVSCTPDRRHNFLLAPAQRSRWPQVE